MTWEEWINSEYNYKNFVTSLNQIYYNNPYNSSLYVNGTSTYVKITDYIDKKNVYEFVSYGSGD